MVDFQCVLAAILLVNNREEPRGCRRRPLFFDFTALWQKTSPQMLIFPTSIRTLPLLLNPYSPTPAALPKDIHVLSNVPILQSNSLDDPQPHNEPSPHDQRRLPPLLVLFPPLLRLVLLQLLHNPLVMLLRNHHSLDHRHGHAVPKLKVHHRLGKVDAQPLGHAHRAAVRHVHGAARAHVLDEQVDVAVLVLGDHAVADGRRDDPVGLVEAVQALQHLLARRRLGFGDLAPPVGRRSSVGDQLERLLAGNGRAALLVPRLGALDLDDVLARVYRFAFRRVRGRVAFAFAVFEELDRAGVGEEGFLALEVAGENEFF
ncbi:hypothetical protein VTK26DRAFT_7556 [Humicola hyalothermophila]